MRRGKFQVAGHQQNSDVTEISKRTSGIRARSLPGTIFVIDVGFHKSRSWKLKTSPQLAVDAALRMVSRLWRLALVKAVALYTRHCRCGH
jgi:hypothetical protein